MTEFNVYCDESCHLEHDQQKVMVLGAVWCPSAKTREVAERRREIKTKHGLPRWFEIKWSKVSPGRLPFYLDVLDYFFDDDDLRFRGLIVPDKSLLRHGDHRQDHDTFYYKMYYYTLLRAILSPDSRAQEELHAVVEEHDAWMAQKKFLLVPTMQASAPRLPRNREKAEDFYSAWTNTLSRISSTVSPQRRPTTSATVSVIAGSSGTRSGKRCSSRQAAATGT